ncbi:3-ketosteroid-9-alpha-monooxygenase, ferredoxin reductase component [Porphyridium purpureum]|uniref:3-ketosteroid-9-alpha-monooxygenase, ferredoxin reductase component n=1 Tax=Porphyridium purpureum TaxID=35688 RepID=A0A5J4Z6I2_PORPP|nr:3-ketosteroid-9-alpha-monooxygenase, ferredoxin reductase component [Porphyridium purpureum]|eukprot:POR4807..scf295_1
MAPYVPFHQGEVAIQRKARTVGMALENGAVIATNVPLHKKHDIESAQTVIVSSVDPVHGHVWVSPAMRFSGKILSMDPELGQALHIDAPAVFHPTDIFFENTKGSAAAAVSPVGVLAIDFANRARYRTNGIVVGSSEAGERIDIHVKEAFPNCPKYITRRKLPDNMADVTPFNVAAVPIVAHSGLSPEARALVERADTLFLGTFFEPTGADANVRGGNPGFIRVFDDQNGTRIEFDDYRGNGMFQSLGNLDVNPRAGITVIDFQHGSVVQITGDAFVVWDDQDLTRRKVALHVSQVRFTRHAFNYHWDLCEYSPYNPQIAPAHEIGRKENSETTLTLMRIKEESPNVKSFRFVSDRTLHFLPGQYATFVLPIPDREGNDDTCVRSWTISETIGSLLGDTFLEISVKRNPDGHASKWLHDEAKLGQQVTLLAVDGHMTPIMMSEDHIPSCSAANVLLFSAGIGITPSMAILRGLRGFNLNDTKVKLVHTERTEHEIPFAGELVRRNRVDPETDVHFFLSRRTQEEFASSLVSQASAHAGYATKDDLSRLLADVNLAEETVAFVCGPAGFMDSTTRILQELGVEHVVSESFAF